jgi:hypothetical protein
MTPESIKVALAETERTIIGIKKDGREKYGVKPGPEWDKAALRRLDDLRAQAKGYRAMLEPKGTAG